MAAPFDASASSSYADYFASHNPFNEEYTTLLAPYVPTEGNTPTQVRALASSAMSNNTATAFLLADDRGKMTVLLQLDKVEDQMGLPATGH